MSALGEKQTFAVQLGTSALGEERTSLNVNLSGYSLSLFGDWIIATIARVILSITRDFLSEWGRIMRRRDIVAFFGAAAALAGTLAGEIARAQHDTISTAQYIMPDCRAFVGPALHRGRCSG